MNASKNLIVGVVAGDPFAFNTWSGSSYYFFNALKQKNRLHSAISSEKTSLAAILIKLMCFDPKLKKWKYKFHLNNSMADLRTRHVKERLDRIHSSEYQTILQVGAWYDCSNYKDKQTVSYHDGNLYAQISSPFKVPAVKKEIIEKALKRERDLYSKIDQIFTMSEWLAGTFVDYFGVSRSKVLAVGAGINLPHINSNPIRNHNRPCVLFVGIDFERKGGKLLLDAWPSIRKEIKNAEMLIIGPEISNPPRGITNIGYLSKLSAKGIQSLLQAYAKASVLILPSYYEPFGIALLEAMAHKLPCIGTNVCAIPEIIDHGSTGFLINPGDSKKLGQRIIQILKNPDAAQQMGEAGFERYQKKYTWDIVAERIIDGISR